MKTKAFMSRPVKAKPPKKSQLRQQLGADIEAFLSQGGTVESVEKGATGLASKRGVPKVLNDLFTTPARGKQQYLGDVVKRLEERKKPSIEPTSKVDNTPKKVPVYDDFGEIIRYEWK